MAVQQEFLKLLAADRPGELLTNNLGAGRDFGLPFLKMAADISAGPPPWHSGSVLAHTARCMNECAGDPAAVFMAFAHDCGKLTTPKALLPHHYGHEIRGLDLVKVWCKRLNLEKDFFQYGRMAVKLHMRAGRYNLIRPGKKLALLEEIFASPAAESFLRLVDADTRSPFSKTMRQHWQAVKELPDDLSLSQRIAFVKKISGSSV